MMAQTVEELAELLDNIKLEAKKNVENFDKILNSISQKLELMSNDTENEDLIKVYLTELKKTLETRHALVIEEFGKIESSFKNIISNQEDLVKSSQMQEMFDIFSTNMQSVAQELFTQRDLLTRYESNLTNYTNDKTDKNEIIDTISNIRKDVEIVNNGFNTAISEINSNIQSIFKNLMVVDPSAQNDVIKRELENIYFSTNAILTSLHTAEQKNDDILSHFENLITKENFEQSQNKLDEIIHKTDTVFQQFETVAHKDDINNKANEFSTILESLKQSLTSSNEEVNQMVKEQLEKLNSVLSAVVTENDFLGFRSDLADFIQKIIDNSSVLNENLNINKSTLENLIAEVEKLDIHKDIEIVSKSLQELNSTILTGAEKITNDYNTISEKLDNLSPKTIEDKIDNVVEKVTETNQGIKVLCEDLYDKFNDDNTEKFQSVNTGIEFLKEMISSSQVANESSLAEKLISLRDMLSSSFNSNDENFVALKSRINEFIENISKISNDTETKINNSLIEIETIKTEVEKIAKDFADWNLAQENHDSKIAGLISSEFNDIGVSIANLQDSVHTGVHLELAKNTEAVETQINKLVDTIETLRSELTASIEKPIYDFDNVFKEVKDRITAVKQEVNLINTDIIDTVSSQAEAILTELQPLKVDLNYFSDLTRNFEQKLNNFDTDNINEIQASVEEIKTLISQKEEFPFDSLIDQMTETANNIKEDLGNRISSSAEDIKTILSVAINNDEVTYAIDDLKSNITQENTKITSLLDILNQKVDVLAMTDNNEESMEILDEINEIKTLISSQKNIIENSTIAKNNAYENKLEELIEKINSIDSSENLTEVRETILTAIINVFEQISFIEESEDIKDFVEEKTDEIAQSLIEVKQQLKQIANNDDNYSYSLHDVETDIAKLRIVLNELSASTSKEELTDISDNIHRIVSSVENLQTSLTQEQISYLKDNFEKLSEDVLSISSRTNKLLLTSDESYNALNNGLNDFSNVIYKLEERINYLDNKEISERIEQKLDNTLSVVSDSANSDKVMRQALIYMGEWIDTTSENIESLCEQSDKINNVEDILESLQDKITEQGQLISLMSDRFDEQQERMDRIEMKLEKILSAIDDIDDTKLTKKVDKIDKQLTKLSSNIEKLTSYVD